MGKYGKKRSMSVDLVSYNLMIQGEGGIGKTTLVKEFYEKLVGSDGYIMLNVGKEDAHDAIEGIVSEDCYTWDKFVAVITDIVKNKDTDYPELRAIAIDTLDELCILAEDEVVRLHNKLFASTDSKKRVYSVKSAFGGFQAGERKVVEIISEQLWKLRREAGVSFFLIGHTKRKTVEDQMTGEAYSILTNDMSNTYFSAFKNKVHLLGTAAVHRDIEREKTGDKNFTGGDVEIKRVKNEKRVITFRDDSYSIDSKSRFAKIDNSCELSADAYIRTLQKAILETKGQTQESQEELASVIGKIDALAKQLAKSVDKALIADTVKDAAFGIGNYNKIADADVAKDVLTALLKLKPEVEK